MKRAKNLKTVKIPSQPQIKTAEDIIAEADENFFLDRMIELNKHQLINARTAIKRLMKEGQLLRNIKKQWNK